MCAVTLSSEMGRWFSNLQPGVQACISPDVSAAYLSFSSTWYNRGVSGIGRVLVQQQLRVVNVRSVSLV